MFQRPRSRSMRGAVVLLGAAAVTLAGCSQPHANNAKDGITVAETTAPSTLDPQGSALFADRFAWQLSYECLLTTSPDGKVEPALATSYKIAPDGVSYTFDLRKGVKFQNGEPLTSADVVYTFTRLEKSPDGISKELFPTLQSVSAVGSSTVKFTLSSPDAGFINNMANPLVWGCAIMSEKAGKAGHSATEMVGTGPWQQVSYRANSQLQLKRYDEYWGTKTASSSLDILYTPKVATQVGDLEAGKVDLIFPDASSAAALKDNSKVSVSKVDTDSTIFLQVNNLAKPFDNQLVRQALAVAFDRGQLADQAYNGAARPSAYIPPGTAWAPAVSDLPFSTNNVAQAKKLLAKAGYPHGFSTNLMYISDYDFGTDNLVALMQSQLAKAGIKVKLVPLEAATWGDKLTSAKYDLSWNAQSYYSNPFQYVQPADGRQGPVPASLQHLLNAALAAKDQTAYQQALVAVEKEEASTVYPTITLLATDMYAAYAKDLTGVNVPPSQSRTFLTQVKHG